MTKQYDWKVGEIYTTILGSPAKLLWVHKSGKLAFVHMAIDMVFFTTEDGFSLGYPNGSISNPPVKFKFEVGKTYKTNSSLRPYAKCLCVDRKGDNIVMDHIFLVMVIGHPLRNSSELVYYSDENGLTGSITILKEEIPCVAKQQ